MIMRDGSEIEALLDALDSLAREAEAKSATWRDVWAEIRNIGNAFNAIGHDDHTIIPPSVES